MSYTLTAKTLKQIAEFTLYEWKSVKTVHEARGPGASKRNDEGRMSALSMVLQKVTGTHLERDWQSFIDKMEGEGVNKGHSDKEWGALWATGLS